jgi:hypothetical protein
LNGSRLLENKNSSLTKNQRQRGRPRSRNKKDIRVSFRVDWNTYKKLLEKAGGSRKLSAWVRKKLEVEKHE